MICCTVLDRSTAGSAAATLRSWRRHHPGSATVAAYIGLDAVPQLDGVEVLPVGELDGGEELWRAIAASAPDLRDGVVLGALLRTLAGRGDGPLVALTTPLVVTAPLTPLLEALDAHELVFAAGTWAAGEDGVDAALGRVDQRVLLARPGDALDRALATWPAWSEHPPAADGEVRASAVQRHLDGLARAAGAVVVDDAALVLGPARVPASLAAVDGTLEAAGVTVCLLDPGALWHEASSFTAAQIAPLLAAVGDDLEDILRGPATDATIICDHDGRPLDVFHRALLRDAIAEGAVTAAPWTATGAAQFGGWLDAPGSHAAQLGVTRYHVALWEFREDLRAAYPDLDGPDAAGFVEWLHTYARAEHGIPGAALPPWPRTDVPPPDGPPAPAPPPAPTQTGAPAWGVNVAGFFRSELGLGEAARLLMAGLDATTVPALPVQGSYVPPCRQEAEFTFTTPHEAPYPINVLCLNGDVIPLFAQDAGSAFFEGRHTIALWWWEIVDAFPADWAAAFAHLDEVWVATEHIHDAIAPHSPVPVRQMRLPVTVPRVRPFSRTELGFPEDGFVFFYMYDYHSTAARKNPVGHVEAFKRAFPPGSGAKLVLKCINADNLPLHHARTLLAIGDHPDITIVDRYVSADEKNAMLAAADCYVSLHRSEGFGLTPAEAMALGRPVIATRYGGVLDFMTDENSYLVDHGWTTVGPGAHPYPPDARWAEPDLDHAARLMREVFDDPAAARQRGQIAARDMRERHAPDVAGRLMRERLQEIYDTLAPDPAPAPAPLAHLGEAASRVAEAPPAPIGRWLAIKRPVRKVTRRLLSPWEARQRRIDSEILAAIEDLQRSVAGSLEEHAARADRHIREERTQTLAALRRIRARSDDHERSAAIVDHEIARLLGGLHALDHRVTRHLDQTDARPYMTQPFDRWEDDVAGAVEGFRDAAPTTAEEAYRAFEDRFRGPRERVIELQRVYADVLRGHEPVLDCGCGRGELLEVLRDAGVAARGVDLDAGMAASAQALGLDVTVGDAIDALRATAPGSIGAVTAMQVVEHLPYTDLRAFLAAAHAALADASGRLVLETVNPHVVTSLKMFWTDPTHEHPLFPEVLLELCRAAGFATAFVFHPGGTGDVDRDRTSVPAYAVVADVA